MSCTLYHPFASLPDRIEILARASSKRGAVFHCANHLGVVQSLFFATIGQLAELHMVEMEDADFLTILNTYDQETSFVVLTASSVTGGSDQVETQWYVFKYRLTLAV